jgi:RNA polymerase sigma-70 factor (ECF subfamily)
MRTDHAGSLRLNFTCSMTKRVEDFETPSIARSYESAGDEALMVWSAEGDARAFDQVVVRHGSFALRVARRLTSDRAHAQDMAQEAMIRAWAHAASFNPRRARFTTWLYRIVVNLCIDHRRHVQVESMPKDFDPPDPSLGLAEALSRDQRQLALTAALNKLPVKQRAAMTLVYDEGLSGVEAARVLGVSTKAVERLLARGRATLTQRLLLDVEGEADL